uniref:Ribosomal protein S19 n=1 Tax=Pseudo-nitzschia multiseries TaxID=37319 RepID=A0A0G3F1T3_PSEMU|nr:ribosomal protein S19 [Pseudo-nitzschia multiseries]AKJ77342.1 ribosomal protein S19 [Pseudo-nitzschia multiseries]
MKRSKWKGPFVKKYYLTEKFAVLPRNYEVTSKIVGLTCNVHSGRTFVKLNITDEMIGHKVGEFVPTRERFVFKKKKRKN